MAVGIWIFLRFTINFHAVFGLIDSPAAIKVARVAFYVNLTGPQAKRQKVAHIKHKAQIN